MADIAKAAGVHQTTVSLALRGHPRIPFATRERIQKLAEKMGYRPNPMVSALIAQRRLGRPASAGSTLAYLHAHAGPEGWKISANFQKVYDEMESYAATRGYRLEPFWLKEPGMSPERLRHILLYRGIRGIIVSPMPLDEWSLAFDFQEFSAVALGLTLRDPALDRVSIDYHAIMGICVGKLMERGYRRIGFSTSRQIDDRVNHLSLGAFLAERERHPRHFVRPFIGKIYNQTAFLQWLEQQRPDALIAAIELDYRLLQRWMEAAPQSKRPKPFLVCLECLENNSHQAGIVQDLAAEARAAVDLVTNRVERAQFGVPTQRQTISVSGFWRDSAVTPPSANSPKSATTKARSSAR